MSQITLVSNEKCYGGHQKVYKHFSQELKCEAHFSLFMPPGAEKKKLPVLYWLSGLTCTEKNFIEKSGFQRHAVEHDIIVVGPDTSPRGCKIEGEEDSWDFGTGAGFYVDATQPKWKEHYRMYSYVTKELPDIISKEFPTSGKISIFGHSMGGHGALICSLKNPGKYASVSAFAPISNPTNCEWGQKAFSGYLGDNQEEWKNYDATELVKAYSGDPFSIMIDQGTDDIYLKNQLLVQNFVSACKDSKVQVSLRMHEGYGHLFFFVGTFLGDHFAYHAKYLHQ